MEKIIYSQVEKIEYDLVIADSILRNVYSDIFCKDTIFIKAGEEAKTFETAERLIKILSDRGMDRSSKIAVVGGGSLSDLVGFVSGIYMRGISHDIIPTTLLSMVDACVGGKTAINFDKKKNFIGVFKQAENVIIDKRFVKTEKIEGFKNGAVEAIKLAALFDADVFCKMRNLLDFEMKCRNEFTSLAVKYCPRKKQEIVKGDYRDKGLRQLLNAGHTFGHAIESEENYKISHGKAVAVGLVLEHQVLGFNTYKIFEDLFVDLYGSEFMTLLNKYRRINLNISGDKKSCGDIINIPIIERVGRSKILRIPKKDLVRGL